MTLRAAALAACLAACSDSTSPPPPVPSDAATDVTRDALVDVIARDSPADIDIDAHADVPADVTVDAPDDVSIDARADVISDAASDVTADATVDAASDAPFDAAPARCATADIADLLRALRMARPAGESAIAAPGQRFEDLRATFDASPEAMNILARARTTARRTVPSIAAGDSGSYQTVASLALAAALVAWHDRDSAAAHTSLQALSVTAVSPSWFATATEVPIFVGASLLDVAAAVDLLTASTLTSAEIDTARTYVGRAAAGVESWLQSGGLLVTAFHEDNHGVRIGAGLAAASMMAPASAVSDEVLAWALSHLSASIERQTGGDSGWAEGSTYFEYAFEIGAPALVAIDRAWTGADSRCASCPSHLLATCQSTPTRIVRPSRDPRLLRLVQWSASLESRGGWLLPIDDSRLMGAPSPLLERLAGARYFSHWSPDGVLGSLGGQVNVGPLVALSLASPSMPMGSAVASRWPFAGTARLDGTSSTGVAMEAFLIAEHGVANAGAGHERPDTLALTVAADGALVLGGSGYMSYDTRAPYARADAQSEITVEGVNPRDLGAGSGGPDATLSPDGDGTTASFSVGGVTVTRAIAFEAGSLVVRDRVELTEARSVAWHWHLRGAIDASSWAWTVGTRRCAATQSGESIAQTRETAPDYDDYSHLVMHPVIRQVATLSAGRHDMTTRITCSQM